MEERHIDLGMNEQLSIREAPSGPYLVLWPLGNGPHWGKTHAVQLEEHSEHTWYARIKDLPAAIATGRTRDEAKDALADAVKQYLRNRVRFIQESAPLIAQFVHGGEEHPEMAAVTEADVPVWRLIAALPEAFVASSRGDDLPLLDEERMSDVAEQHHIPKEAVRAAVAYYFQYKPIIRNAIVQYNRERLDEAFARLEATTGMTEAQLASAFDPSPGKP